MSHFTRGPLAHLRKVRRQVFGFGQGRAAAEQAEYRRGSLAFRVKAEPRALDEGEIGEVRYYAQGWLVRNDELAAAGVTRPLPGDRLIVKGETWTVFEPGNGPCFARRSYGADILLYTKLTNDS